MPLVMSILDLDAYFSCRPGVSLGYIMPYATKKLRVSAGYGWLRWRTPPPQPPSFYRQESTMWIIARLITGAPMVVNTNNVAAFVDNMNEATKVV